MPGLNASLYLGLSGLQAQQAALNVVGQNIANVNTPGYSRQRSDFSSNTSMLEGQVYFGTGVSLTTVQGIRDKYLDLQIYRETSKQTGASERYSVVNAISGSLADTGATGIAAQIQAFFQGFQDLAAQPENSALRTNLISKAQSMVSSLKSRYQLLEDQRTSADQAVGSTVAQINTLTDQIAQLNQRIMTETTPGADNDARDQRKALTDKLAGLVGIQVVEGSKGEYQISLDAGAGVLVSGGSSYSLSADRPVPPTSPNYLVVHSNMGGTAVDVTRGIKEGQLGARLDLRDNILAGYQRQLDQLAAGIASKVNLQHRQGLALNGTTTNLDFFVGGKGPYGATGLPPAPPNAEGDPAKFYKGMVNELAVNSAILNNHALIAAAGPGGAVGDNANANALANLQSATNTVDTNGDGTGDSGPYSSIVGTLVSDVGNATQTYDTQNTAQQNLVVALQTQRDRISGVSLDEEAANMMTLQRGYQASARFISVINQLTDQLVNQFGK